MEWLKDKKNLPVVVALAVVMFLAAGGAIAFELGLFPSGGSSDVVSTPVTTPVPSGPPPGTGVRPPPVGRIPGGPGVAPALKTAVVVKKPGVLNPAVGADPFSIPGGQKQLASTQTAEVKTPLRDVIGPLDLFQIHAPSAPAAPALPIVDGSSGTANASANYRLSGVITGAEGINAILEVGGQSQTVKPGDSLPDGSVVQNIQTTSITLRNYGGGVTTLPLSAGTPDQGSPQGNPYQPGFNGPYPPGFNGPNYPQGQDN